MIENIGSNLDDFLKEENILEETNSTAIKRVLAYQIEQALKEQKFSKHKHDRQNDKIELA